MRFTFFNQTASSFDTHLRGSKNLQLNAAEARTYYWSRKRLTVTRKHLSTAKCASSYLMFYPLRIQINYDTKTEFIHLPKLCRHSNLATRVLSYSNTLLTCFSVWFQAYNFNNLCLQYSQFLHTNHTLCRMLIGLAKSESPLINVNGKFTKPLQPKTESLLTVFSMLLV